MAPANAGGGTVSVEEVGKGLVLKEWVDDDDDDDDNDVAVDSRFFDRRGGADELEGVLVSERSDDDEMDLDNGVTIILGDANAPKFFGVRGGLLLSVSVGSPFIE